MDNSFKNQIDAAKSILVLLPQKPYFDQVAAGLSLYLILKDKKDTTIACPSDMLVEFNRLVGVNKIAKELGNKNLVIKFAGYRATDIERVSYDIEDGEFRLTVIPKTGITPPAKDQINVGYSGVAADCVILIGGVNSSHFPALSMPEFSAVKLIHLGVKSFQSPPDKQVISFAKPASSISELVGVLIKELGYEIDADASTNLLMGLEEGSTNFSGPQVTADTFQMAADLLRAGGTRKPKIETTGDPFRVSTPEAIEQEKKPSEPEAPKEWVGPKIYKGTSIS
jgi:hypothetical protein